MPLDDVNKGRRLGFVLKRRRFRGKRRAALGRAGRRLVVTVTGCKCGARIVHTTRRNKTAKKAIFRKGNIKVGQTRRFLNMSLISRGRVVFVIAGARRGGTVVGSVVRGTKVKAGTKAVTFSLPIADATKLQVVRSSKRYRRV